MTPGPRVALLVTASLSDDTGYTVNVRRVLDALRKDGVDVSVIQIVDRHALRSAKQWSLDDPRASTVRAPVGNAAALVRRLDELRFRVALGSLIRRSRADVVHARGIRAGALGAGLGRRGHLLLDVRGDVAAEMRALCGPDSWQYRRALRDQHLALDAAEAFVGVSDGMIEWLIRSAPRLASLPHTVIPCSVEVPPDSDTESCDRVVYAGGFQVYQPAREVFGQLHRVAELAHIEQVEVYTYDRSDVVRSVGAEVCPEADIEYLDPAEVAQRLPHALVGVIPRVEDQANMVACPTKIAEYLAAGVPVLVSRNLGGWSKRLSEWGVGCELEAADELVGRFCENVRRDRVAMGSLCRSIARQHFSIEAASASLVRLYSQMGGNQ